MVINRSNSSLRNRNAPAEAGSALMSCGKACVNSPMARSLMTLSRPFTA